jgi:hypothetical protein
MAGKYGPADVTVTYDDGPGGTGRAITNFILEGISVKLTAITMDTTALGDGFEEHTPTGRSRTEPITLTVIWDTTGTTGTHAVLGSPDNGQNDATRTLVVVYGDSKTYTVETRLTSWEVVAQNDQVQTGVAEILPTGTGTWS